MRMSYQSDENSFSFFNVFLRKGVYMDIDKKRHEQNPFVKDLLVPIRKKFINSGDGLYMNTETGETTEARISQVIHVDKEKFIKLFTDQLKKFFDLKPSTQKLLQVLLFNLSKKVNKDLVYLDFHVAEEYFSENADTKIMSKATYYRALEELIEKEFIAESNYKYQYYINPKLFFSGDRMKLIQEYRVVEKDALKQLERKEEQLEFKVINNDD